MARLQGVVYRLGGDIVKMERVESTAVTFLGYDDVSRRVGVVYAGGGAYVYEDVSPTTYRAVRDAPSIGVAVNSILKKHRYTRLL